MKYLFSILLLITFLTVGSTQVTTDYHKHTVKSKDSLFAPYTASNDVQFVDEKEYIRVAIQEGASQGITFCKYIGQIGDKYHDNVSYWIYTNEDAKVTVHSIVIGDNIIGHILFTSDDIKRIFTRSGMVRQY